MVVLPFSNTLFCFDGRLSTLNKTSWSPLRSFVCGTVCSIFHARNKMNLAPETLIMVTLTPTCKVNDDFAVKHTRGFRKVWARF